MGRTPPSCVAEGMSSNCRPGCAVAAEALLPGSGAIYVAPQCKIPRNGPGLFVMWHRGRHMKECMKPLIGAVLALLHGQGTSALAKNDPLVLVWTDPHEEQDLVPGNGEGRRYHPCRRRVGDSPPWPVSRLGPSRRCRRARQGIKSSLAQLNPALLPEERPTRTCFR